MKRIIFNLLEPWIERYRDKHYKGNKNVSKCHSRETRNRNKNDKYKQPLDKPGCVIFKDDRCCGSCLLTETCEHIVNCHCSGFVKDAMGGNDKRYYFTKASKYVGGKLKKGKFDWEYWNYINSKK